MPEHVHLVGIGGISMSGIGKVLLENGYIVSGSDIEENNLIKELRNQGVKITIGHSADNVIGANLLVKSNAISDNNVEIKYAIENDILVLERAEMIAKLMESKHGIAISGTHGKTTTTAMTAHLLKKGNYDPTVFLGGELETINGNACQGDGKYLVTEADESDASLLYFDPDMVAITNIELDHHDYYDNADQLLSTFSDFVKKVPDSGKVFLGIDNNNIKKIINDSDNNDSDKFLTYGIGNGDIKARDINLLTFGSYFTVEYKGKIMGEISLPVPGKHNILNSLASIGIAMYIGMSFTEIKTILENFPGVKRRFEKKGLIGDILIIDDYAHHPTEIKETLKAAKNTGYERIIAVFQPHRYTRTKHLLKEFSQSFDLVDQLIVTSIYSAGESPQPGVNAKKIVDLIKKDKKDFRAKYIEDFDQIIKYIKNNTQPRDLILTIGAGDVYKIGERLIDIL